MNKFVRTNSGTGSKFSKTSFEAIMHVRDCSCAPILRFFYAASGGATANRQIPDYIFWSIFTSLRTVFLCGVRWRHSKPPNSGLHFLVNFYQFEEGSWGRSHYVANYASIWTLFSPTVRGLDVLYKALNVQ